MLSRKSVISIRRVILFGKCMLAMPYDWDHTTNRVSMGSFKQKVGLKLGACYLYMEAVYQAWVLYAEFGVDDMPLQSYMKLISHFLTRLTGIVVSSLAFTNAWEKGYFINQIFNMNQRFQVYDNGRRQRDTCERLFRFILLFVVFQPLMPAINYVGENRDKRYWHGALLPSSIQPFFIPLFFVVEYWISLVALAGVAIAAYFMVSYSRCAPRWTRTLIEKETEINENEEDGHDTFTHYRAQQILNRVYNNSYSFIWAFGMVCTLIDLVMMIVCTIRLTPTMEFPANLIFPVGLLGLLLVTLKLIDPAADVTSVSHDFIAHQRRSGRLEKMKRMRSLRPLTVESWMFFTVNKSTTAAFLNQTADYSVSVLLMT